MAAAAERTMAAEVSAQQACRDAEAKSEDVHVATANLAASQSSATTLQLELVQMRTGESELSEEVASTRAAVESHKQLVHALQQRVAEQAEEFKKRLAAQAEEFQNKLDSSAMQAEEFQNKLDSRAAAHVTP